MARDSFFTDVVFVREDLRGLIIAEGITGCRWQTKEEYQLILNS